MTHPEYQAASRALWPALRNSGVTEVVIPDWIAVTLPQDGWRVAILSTVVGEHEPQAHVRVAAPKGAIA